MAVSPATSPRRRRALTKKSTAKSLSKSKSKSSTKKKTTARGVAAAAAIRAGWTAPQPRWFSLNESKRAGDIFFLKYAVFWIGCVFVVVATRLFELFTPAAYMAFGLLISVPCVVYPLLFPAACDVKTPWYDRYTTKANMWIWIMAYIANHVWTHYFYKVLGCKYTFVAHRFNDVPFCLYLMSHSYFAFYHALSNVVLRRAWSHFEDKINFKSFTALCAIIGVLSYFVAFSETFTIQNFQYYEIADRHAMYTVGSIFYALYFVRSAETF
jgi:cycloeucalenol cycloisomerase